MGLDVCNMIMWYLHVYVFNAVLPFHSVSTCDVALSFDVVYRSDYHSVILQHGIVSSRCEKKREFSLPARAAAEARWT